MSSRPLVVDLDGTLIRSDLLIESGISYLKESPLKILKIPHLVSQGKAVLKRELAHDFKFDATTLPYVPEVLEFIREQKSTGREIVLATASDYALADEIANHLGLFDLVLATKDNFNLSAKNKADTLVNRYGEKEFDYMGNSMDDIDVWKVANKAIVVNPERGVLSKARELGNFEKIIDDRQSSVKVYAKAMRLHQWAKNSLIFVPLLAAHQALDLGKLSEGLFAFLLFGLCASSVYLINDILDIPDDRHHPSKKKRPIPAGLISLKQVVLFAPALCGSAFILSAIFLPPLFTLCLAAYMILTSLYSFALKRVLFIDVITLAMLYTQRIIAGVAVFEVRMSFWLLALSTFLFLSLALVKRYTELIAARNRNELGKTKGRGYHTDDIELISSLGGSAGYISALVLALYIQDPETISFYSHPEYIWLACPVLLYWISRTWILAHRGEMNDDPVVFAMKDKVSLICGVMFAIIFWLAI